MLAGYKARTEVLGISFIFLGSLWHFLLAKIKRHLEHTQGVNEALIGDGKRPFPNRVYQSIFPIFFLVYVDLLFINNIFLAYQPFTFLKNLSGFAAFYFWLFFLLCYLHIKQLQMGVCWESKVFSRCTAGHWIFVFCCCFFIVHSASLPCLAYRGRFL